MAVAVAVGCWAFGQIYLGGPESMPVWSSEISLSRWAGPLVTEKARNLWLLPSEYGPSTVSRGKTVSSTSTC